MPSATAPQTQDNDSPSQALGRHADSAHVHHAFSQAAHDAGQGQSTLHAHGQTHDHSVPHTHSPHLGSLRVEVSPVLAGVWTRILATLAMLSLLWLAIFWAFIGNV